jgi:hypothetical protein
MNYFFTFASGTYEEYKVSGLYKTDHPVTLKDWEKFKQFLDEMENDVYEAYKKKACERVGVDYEKEKPNTVFWDSPEYEEFIQWRDSQETAENRFKAVHEMQPVEYIEFWSE